jgi:hypothetical protein
VNYRLSLKALFVVVALAWLSTVGLSQSTSKTGPKYDTTKEVKIKGVIEEVRDVPTAAGGTQLVVKTDSKSVLVYVGPGQFLKELEMSFNKGDQVDVTGCKALNESNEEQVLAREVVVGSNTFTLRDDKGVPIWSGWKPAKASGK